MKAFIGKIFSPHNRGILLDVLIFFLNILLVHLAVNVLADFRNQFQNYDWHAYVFLSFLTGVLFLSPVGASLKRHGFWTRLRAQGRAETVAVNAIDYPNFSRVFCFLWMYVLSLIVGMMWCELVLEKYLSWTALFLGCLILPPIYAAGGSWIVRRFFVPPEKPPIFQFLATPVSAAFGDIFIFLNMICFQILWSFFNDAPFRVDNAWDYFFNIVGFILMTLMFYFPPRNFYLLEDVERPAVWLTILLAILPSFLFLIFGLRIF